MRRLKTVDEKTRRRGWFRMDCFIFQSCFGKPPSNTCGGRRWGTNYKTSTVLSRANFRQSTVLYVKRYRFQNRSCINMIFSGNDNLTTFHNFLSWNISMCLINRHKWQSIWMMPYFKVTSVHSQLQSYHVVWHYFQWIDIWRQNSKTLCLTLINCCAMEFRKCIRTRTWHLPEFDSLQAVQQ